MLQEVNNKLRTLNKGDIVYDIIKYKSLKVRSKEHLSNMIEDNKHLSKTYNRIKYEAFDPERHLPMNKNRSDNHIPKLF